MKQQWLKEQEDNKKSPNPGIDATFKTTHQCREHIEQRHKHNENKHLNQLTKHEQRIGQRTVQGRGVPKEIKNMPRKITFDTNTHTWNCNTCGKQHRATDIQNEI